LQSCVEFQAKLSREASHEANILALQQGYKASCKAILWAMLRHL